MSGVLRGHTAEAVAAEVAVHSVGDAVGVRYSAIRRLVPEMGAFVARFADSEYKDAFLKDDHPVCVDWYEAAAFAHSVGCELPQEFVWHWAALGGQPQATTLYPIPLDHAIWNPDETRYHTASVVHEIAQRRNGYGLVDPIGNVWEWQGNRFVESYHELIAEPYGPFDTEYFSLRGGSWFNQHRDNLALPKRLSAHAGGQYDYLGFRLWRPMTPAA